MARGAWCVVLCTWFAATAPLLAQTRDEAFHHALQLKEAGQLADAEHELKQLLQFNPTDADAHFELGNLYSMQYDNLSPKALSAPEKLSAAGREFLQASMLREDFLPAQFNLGIVLKRQERYAEARQVFKKILEKNPDQIDALLQIGETYERQGFFDEAEDAYREARQRNYSRPDVQDALDDLARHRQVVSERAKAEDMNSFNTLAARNFLNSKKEE